MHITQEMRQQACEGLLHFTPKKALARELGVSVGSIRDWAIYIQHGFFDWVDKPWVTRRPELLQSAVNYWFEHYPIGYSDVAKQFAVWRETGHIVPKDPPQLQNSPSSCAPSASYSGTSNQKPALEPSEWPSKNSPTFLPIVP